jgi:hypothetical protein
MWIARIATRSNKRKAHFPSHESRPKLGMCVFTMPHLDKTCITYVLSPLTQTQADADAYNMVTAARAAAQALQIQAEAQAEATRLTAKAEADAVKMKAAADGDVKDRFAQEMELRRIDVERVKSYGNKTIFVPTAEAGNKAGDALAYGMAAGIGSREGRQ